MHLLLILALLLSTAGSAVAQDSGEEAFIAGLLPRLSPEAKVGQLFIASFRGIDVSGSSDVADLILNFRIGGVVLSIAAGNIDNTQTGLGTPLQVATLTGALQNLSRQTPRAANPSPAIPLLVALNQDGDGPPNSQITAGLTPAPSYMALGATWDRTAAQDAGRLVGQELSALGVNFLLGPSLDVRVQPSTTRFDPGVNVFGGDPYWVGTLGRAYVRGLRAGSTDRLAVALKSFPGQGSLDDDSFTIDRSLDDLQKIDLPPFWRVLPGSDATPAGRTRPLADALLTTNVRFRGFAGNIRERTRPISIDTDALQTLLELPQLKAWRDAGGLVVGDVFGDSVVRDYYAASASGTFSVTQAALEAFQAGNDLLILRNLSADPAENAALVRDVIRSFRQRYSTDPAFQARVDSAVQRILRLKYRLYPNFDFGQVVTPFIADSASIGTGITTTLSIANAAATLLYPPPDRFVPARPSAEDTLLIATDDRVVQDCPGCPPRATLSSAEIGRAIGQAYGVPTENITTTRFSELRAFVLQQPGAPDLSSSFEAATWVVLAMQAIDPRVPASDAAQLLLGQRADLLAGKRVVGLIFGPPQGYSALEMSRFSALLALYDKTPSAVEAAVRWLGADTAPPGKSPISLPELNYDLTRQTEPDPAQSIPLFVGSEAVEGQPTPAPPQLRVGDTVQLRTGVIVDRNGHAVPDGTPVRFQIQYEGDSAPTLNMSTTQNGVARTEFTLDQVGTLLIRAASEPALNSITIQIKIDEAGGAIVATVAPTPTPTPPPPPTSTPRPSPTPTITPTPTPTFWESFVSEKPQRANWGEWLLALVGVVLISGGSFWRVRSLGGGDAVRALRAALWCAVGGLLGYVWFSLNLPGSDLLRSAFGASAALLAAVIGGALPLVILGRRA